MQEVRNQRIELIRLEARNQRTEMIFKKKRKHVQMEPKEKVCTNEICIKPR